MNVKSDRPPFQQMDTDTLPDESKFGLAAAVRGESLRALLTASSSALHPETIEIQRVRYRPGRSCTVLASARMHDAAEGQQKLFYLKTLERERFNAEAARVVARGWAKGHCLAQPMVDRSTSSLLFEFPQDAELDLTGDWISAVTDPRAPGLDCRLLRYKPESRAVFRVESRDSTGPSDGLPPVTVHRIVPHRRFEAVRRLLTDVDRIVEACEGLGSARALRVDTERARTVHAWIDGTRLSSMLRRGDGPAAVDAAARALVSFHTVSTKPLPSVAPDFLIGTLEDSLSALDGYPLALRTDAAGLRQVVARLRRFTNATRFGAVHGDYHQGQLLIEGGRPHLLDFDRVHAGDQLEDVGEFVAQLRALGARGKLEQSDTLAENFVSLYERGSRIEIDRDRVRLWAVVGLGKLVLKELRRLKPDWTARIRPLVEEALAVGEG